MCLTDVFEFAIYNNRSLLIHNYTVCVQIVQLFVKYFAQSLVFCVVFCKSWIVRLSFSFWPLYCMFLFRFSARLAIVLHVLVSIHGFWSPLWYFQTFFLNTLSIWLLCFQWWLSWILVFNANEQLCCYIMTITCYISMWW